MHVLVVLLNFTYLALVVLLNFTYLALDAATICYKTAKINKPSSIPTYEFTSIASSSSAMLIMCIFPHYKMKI